MNVKGTDERQCAYNAHAVPFNSAIGLFFPTDFGPFYPTRTGPFFPTPIPIYPAIERADLSLPLLRRQSVSVSFHPYSYSSPFALMQSSTPSLFVKTRNTSFSESVCGFPSSSFTVPRAGISPFFMIATCEQKFSTSSM